MLVPTKVFDIKYIISNVNNPDKIKDYVWSIIPDIYRHQVSLYSNQCFYISYAILSSSDIREDVKRRVSDILCDGLHVVGYLDGFKFLSDTEKYINFKKLGKYRDKEKNKYGKSN